MAERSLHGELDEAAFRSAISRAYYAAYLVTREYVQAHGFLAQPSTGRRWGSHERIIFSIGLVRASGVRNVRKALFRLKKQRTNADYDLDYVAGRAHATKAIQDAAMIIAWVDALPE